jgi:hypothetical protein
MLFVRSQGLNTLILIVIFCAGDGHGPPGFRVRLSRAAGIRPVQAGRRKQEALELGLD